MVKYFLRKTLYKELDKPSQDMIFALFLSLDIIRFLTITVIWITLVALPIIPSVIVFLCDSSENALIMQFAFFVYFLFCYGLLLLVLILFYEPFVTFLDLVAQKIYFWICTTKGDALSKSDFEIIKRSNPTLYDSISSQGCLGHCYITSYELLETLQKGEIEFVAIRKATPILDDEEIHDGRAFKIHVLYLNNGWAFDTYSRRQYPIEKLHQIFNAKVYKSFDFNDICNKSFNDFGKEQDFGISKWCNDNDCSTFIDRRQIS